MSITSDRRGPLTDADRTEVDRARAAARVRFARFAEMEDGGEPATVDPDDPPMTEAQLARFRPAAEVVSGLVAARLGREAGRSGSRDLENSVSVRLDSDVVEALRSSGEGWQGRVNDLLRGALAIGPGAVASDEPNDMTRSETLSDVVRRAFAGEPVAPDEVRRMAEAVRRHMESADPHEVRA